MDANQLDEDTASTLYASLNTKCGAYKGSIGARPFDVCIRPRFRLQEKYFDNAFRRIVGG
jgi:hypothetical protein